MVKNHLETIAVTHGDEGVFGFVDVENEPIITNEANVFTIPTVVIYQNGVLIDKLIGILTEEELRNSLFHRNPDPDEHLFKTMGPVDRTVCRPLFRVAVAHSTYPER